MKDERLEALIEHDVAELRAAFPQIAEVRSSLESWNEGEARRYSVGLDIRWAGHQTLVSGPARSGMHEAVRAAFDAARERLRAGCAHVGAG
ncbi:MAG: hypothetical protein N2653_00665 [Burkholderiales bacterium]|nr:hypothetical protein [Burkholderiales bacterium]